MMNRGMTFAVTPKRALAPQFGSGWLRTLLGAVAVTFLVLGSGVARADDAAASTAACDAADEARKAASKAKMEWRDVKKTIKAGRKAAEEGDHAKAIELCETAKFQGEAGVAQAEIEKNTWMNRVPK